MGMTYKEIGVYAWPNMIELHDYRSNDILSINANFIEFFGTESGSNDDTSRKPTKIGMSGNHLFYVRESYYTVKNLIDNLKG